MSETAKKKTAREILEETAAFYTSENRAVVKGGHGNHGSVSCHYLTNDGKMCAVGRCLIDPSEITNEPVIDIPQLEDRLKSEYRGHPIDFWSDLQDLHDSPNNWNREGLSTQGEDERDLILRTWATS